MLLHESSHLKVKFSQPNTLLCCEWKNTLQFSDEIYKSELEKVTQFIEIYQPSRIIFEARNFRYVLVPVVQQWHNEEVIPKWYQAGLKYIAFVELNDFLSEVSIQQTLKDVNESFEIVYLRDKKDVRKWISKR